jgi:hypothetical protein
MTLTVQVAVTVAVAVAEWLGGRVAGWQWQWLGGSGWVAVADWLGWPWQIGLVAMVTEWRWQCATATAIVLLPLPLPNFFFSLINNKKPKFNIKFNKI